MAIYSRVNVTSVANMSKERHIDGETSIKEMTTEITTRTENTASTEIVTTVKK